MPVCPNCNYEYVEGVTICPDCNTALVDEKDLPKIEELSEKDWVLVYTSGDEYEVQMLKEVLESGGVEANVLSQKDRNFPAPGDFSIVKLFVRKSDLKQALNYIEDAKKNNSGPEENSEES